MSSNNSGNSIKSGFKGLDYTNKIVQFKPRSELSYKIERSSGQGASASNLDLKNLAPTRVDDRIRAELDSLATGANRKASQIKLSADSLGQERQLLVELKTAFQSGNEVAVVKIKEDLKSLREQRESTSNRQKSEQISSSAENSLRFSSSEIRKPAGIKNDPVDAKRKIPPDTKQIESQIEEVNDDLRSLEAQSQEVKQVREELARSLNAERAKREQEVDNPVLSIDTATGSARSISLEAMALDKDELLSAVADKIDLETVIFALKN